MAKNESTPTCNGDKIYSHFRLIHSFILLYGMLLYIHRIEVMSNCSCYLYCPTTLPSNTVFIFVTSLLSQHTASDQILLFQQMQRNAHFAEIMLAKYCTVFIYIFLHAFSSPVIDLFLCCVCLKNEFISSIPFFAECDGLSCCYRNSRLLFFEGSFRVI